MSTQGTGALRDLTVFVVSAGIAQADEILDVKPESLVRMLDVNTKGFWSA
ncbi:hypothetical protein [Glutamicibacter nicotianae]|nr:hypothetical protein [Glutamicibacter nicotianae]MBM7766594.1 NADP-dependent 3-hydroxy acid dehydrogenase YdfG [Glutamicibacter nicotianae]